MFVVNIRCVFLFTLINCFTSVYLDENAESTKDTHLLDGVGDQEELLKIQFNEDHRNREHEHNSKFVVVCIKDGCLRGCKMTQYEHFLGIPYAKPPVGTSRFTNPIRNDPYTEDIRNATEEVPCCCQKNSFIQNAVVEGLEDCLYLNVYRPKGVRRHSRLPVMVHIHGGAFSSGSSGPTYMGPKYFMQNGETIMVTVNYRLGVLGFLSTGDEFSPGNFALKDQLLALKWVKKNIRHFGGDPHSVTLIGQSAGAASVQMHMMSPASRGYFHRAILQSGSAIAPYNNPTEDPLALARRHAKVLGVHEVHKMSNRHLIDNLRKFDVVDLVESVERLKYWSIDPLTLYRPVIEKDEPGAFLTKDPRVVWQTGDFEAVPWIVTFVQNEGFIRSGGILTNETLIADLTDKFDDLMPKLLEIPIKTAEDQDWILRGIKDFYFNGTNDISYNSGQGLTDLLTDRAFVFPMYCSILQFLQYSNPKLTPVNIYKFDFKGSLSYANLFSTNNDYGVVHCDDLIYTYRQRWLFKHQLEPFTTEYKMMQTLIETFEYFAKYGVAKKWGQTRHCRKSNKPPVPNKCPQICEYQRFARNDDDNVEVSTTDEYRMNAVQFWRSIDIFSEKRLLQF